MVVVSDSIKLIDEKQKDEFNRLASHPMQSWEWGKFREVAGQKVVRLGAFSGKKLTDVWQVFFHHIPKTNLTIGYLPKSKLPDKNTLDFIKEIARSNRAIFVKIEPNVSVDNINTEKMVDSGLIKGKPLFTKYSSLIDLTRSKEQLLASFKPKTRYNIKIAEKHGVTVQEDGSPEAFDNYTKLMLETIRRQGFFAHDPWYHRKQWSILQPAGISHLLTAKWEGKTLASFILFVFNNKLYYPYGASTREHRELMAPTLLMWEAIRFGKKHGCTSFDLWGDIEPDPPTNHPYYGFHKFKEGFSPELVEFVGTWDLVIDPVLYRLYGISDWARWKYLRMIAKIQ